MPADTIPIQSQIQTAGPVMLVGTISGINEKGQNVDFQVVVAADENGKPIAPLSELTGQAILEQLQLLNANLMAALGL